MIQYKSDDDDDDGHDAQVSAEQRSAHWKDLEDAVCTRSRNVEEAGAALAQARYATSHTWHENETDPMTPH